MKNYFKKRNLLGKLFMATFVLMATVPLFAQGGAAALTDAATEIKTGKTHYSGNRRFGRLYWRCQNLQQMAEWRPRHQ